MEAFFKACDEQERVLFETFLMTGMREQELMHLTWRDIDLAHGIVRVRHKPEYGWTPKAYKKREIPIPDKLVQSLKGWKAKADASCPLVFPNSNCSLLSKCVPVTFDQRGASAATTHLPVEAPSPAPHTVNEYRS